MSTIEGKYEAEDITLYTKTWKPSTPPLAKLIFIHGFNDHINRYENLFRALSARGIEVHGFDQRGWGRSVHDPSQRGLTGPTETVIADIVGFISTVLPSPVPVFIMGHSMGGGEVLTLACSPKYAKIFEQVRGWILEGPLIGFAKGYEPSYIAVFFGRLAKVIFPHKQRYSSLPAENLTRDPDVIKSLKEDPLLHGYGTFEGLSSMLDRMTDLSSGNIKLDGEIKSIWIGHGTIDRATSFEASQEWYEEQCKYVEDKQFKAYDGCYHQLHTDLPETARVFAEDVGNWILSRLGNRTSKL